MAIQIDIQQSNFGVPFQAAYFRIVSANLARQRAVIQRHTVTIDVVGYAAQPQNEDTKEIDFRRYHAPLAEVYDQPASNFLAQCYSWISSQTDMAGAVAV